MSREMTPEGRAKLAEKIGLAADASDEAILEALDVVIAKADQRTVDAAIAARAIPASQERFWLSSLKRDRKSTREVLAAMAKPTPAPLLSAASTKSAPAPSTTRVPPDDGSYDDDHWLAPELPAPAVATVSHETWVEAERQALAWAAGQRDGIEAPPDYQPKWYELFPPTIPNAAGGADV